MSSAQLDHRKGPLTESEKKHIRSRYAAGVTLKVLTKAYRVGREEILKVIGKPDKFRHIQ